MRGSPPLHLVLFAVGFAFLAVPLAQLTFARPAPKKVEAVVADKPAGAVPTVISLRFAHAPTSVSLKQSIGTGDELLKNLSSPLPSELETTVDLEIPADGIDFSLKVTWPEGTPNTAVTVDLEPSEMDRQSQTLWSNGPTLEETLGYKWKS